MPRCLALAAAVLLAGCGGQVRTGGVDASAGLECAPFARQVSGIQLYGEAYSWWDQAAGRYARGSEPVPGGVLVLRRTARLPFGHVAVVGDLVSAREVHVTQANWVHRRVTRDEPVVDVSPGNDWSQVRVWWALSGALGATTYPAYGFIAPEPGTARVAAR
ncbi:MAG: CHAP domain-containing protein [Acetobacteraceae bacterium]